MKQIEWFYMSLMSVRLEDDLFGVYSCTSMRNAAFGEVQETIFIYILNGILYKKVVSVLGTRWYTGS